MPAKNRISLFWVAGDDQGDGVLVFACDLESALKYVGAPAAARPASRVVLGDVRDFKVVNSGFLPRAANIADLRRLGLEGSATA